VFHEPAQEPGLPTIFIRVPCHDDPQCELAYYEFSDIRVAYLLLDGTPIDDADCPLTATAERADRPPRAEHTSPGPTTVFQQRGPAVTTHQLPRYGKLTLTDTTNPDRGEVTYRFRAPHADGAVVITPCLTALQGDQRTRPDGVRVQFGIGDRWADHTRNELPIIYRVPLCSGVIIDPFEFLTRAEPWLRFSRPTGPYTSIPAPNATNNYMSAIFTEILIVWCARPDVDDLVNAVARREAPGRLADLTRTITTRRREIETALAELARLEALAAEIRTFTDDRETIHS